MLVSQPWTKRWCCGVTLSSLQRSSGTTSCYEILVPLKGPNGKTAWIRTIWIVLKGQQRARLVTVLPEARP